MKQTKWRVPIESYVIIEAETPDEARREVEALQEKGGYSCNQNIKLDLLLNAEIGTVTEEEPWEE